MALSVTANPQTWPSGLKAEETETTRILLIEDNEDDAIIARALISRIPGVPFSVDWVSSYTEGLSTLQKETHQICLLDYNLGTRSGLDLLREAIQYGIHIPIIMITGTTDRSIDMQALRLGAADYVIKGETNPTLLERVIRHARERHRAEQERETLHQDLLESSRRLGMSEVATAVLHNIGNLLNGLNVSTGLLAQRLQELPVGDVPKISNLMKAHTEDIAHFLTENSKGKQVMPYMEKLGKHLTEQYDLCLHDLETVMAQLEDVKDLVMGQESLTRAERMLEPVSLKDLLEKALNLSQSQIIKHHVAIERDYETIPKLVIDKHLCLRILINLIHQANESMTQPGHGPHRLSLRLRLHQDRQTSVQIQIQDTGCGIPPEQLTKIFSQELSETFQDRDAGLHESALAAKNMGGSLTALSEGQGKGATYTLSLPAKVWEGP
ncbi:MAG: sensor histidine kinase [Nitrospirales bacterium]